MRPSLCLLAVLVAASTAAADQPAAVFENVSIVDVERGQIEAGRTVVVSGNRITAVGPSGSIAVPAGARRFDGAGKYLIPGLWDFHVHAATPWLGDLFMPLLVANGVTSVREMFGVTAFAQEWRRRAAEGAPAPRVATFGSLVDGDPAIWPGSVVARSAAEGIRIVDSLRAAKVEFVKVYSRLDEATYAAIAARAKETGIRFAGHIPNLVAPAEAARLGQATVEHLTQVLTGCSSKEEEILRLTRGAVASAKRWDSAGLVSRAMADPLITSYDPARCARLADGFKAAGTVMVPTITVLRSVAMLDDTTLAADDRLKYIPAAMKNGWNPRSDFRFRMLTPEDWARRKRAYDLQLRILRLFRERGVTILAGTDLANPYIFPGSSLHDELEHLVGIGMTPVEALRAATIEPARFLGAADSLGSIATGKLADLVLLGANPLERIGAVRSVEVVVVNGRVYDGAAREKLLADGIAAAARAPR